MNVQTITYGDNDEVTFPFTQMDVDQQSIFASDGIQLEGTRYVFNIRGTITADTPDDLCTLMCDMRNFLSKNRLKFNVKWNAVDMYKFDGTTDSRWGPHPGPLTFRKFSGGIAANYVWSVEVTTKECIGSSCSLTVPNTLVLSVVLSYGHQVDMNGMTTRTLAGKLVISSQAIKLGQTADSFRWIVWPSAPQGFKLVDQNFRTSEDGRELYFSFTQQEILWALPDPITNGDASFTIRLSDKGMLAYFSLDGFFEAPRSVSKSAILTQVFNLVNSKLGPYLNSTTNPVYFENQEISTPNMYERNRVNFSFAGVFAVGGPNTGLTPQFYASLKRTIAQAPINNGATSHEVWPYGGDVNASSGVQSGTPLFNFDACLGLTSLNRISPQSPGNTPGTGLNDGNPNSGTGNINETTGNASTSHLTAPYIAYSEVMHFMFDNGVEVFVPKVANSNPIVQQMRAPTLTCIQAGYAVRYAQSSADVADMVPPPTQTSQYAVVISSNIAPSAPEPVGDGTFSEWTIHWEYVIKATMPLTSDYTLGWEAPYFPRDPRRQLVGSSGNVKNAGPVKGPKNDGYFLIDPTQS